MNKQKQAEQDIIAALLKITHENGLITESTYRAARSKLFCTFDADAPVGYHESNNERRSA